MSQHDPTPGRVLRGYQLNEQLGSGGVGIVFKAYQDVIDRDVAIKVIRPKFANHPDFARRFRIEAQTVARLEHPHIVPLYDYWRDSEGAYLVMRWIRGGSLRDIINAQTSWSLMQVSRLLDQLASALDFAHSNNVVHRDIKPENVLIDEANNAYLSDFGIAIDLRNNEVLQENISYGSPQYAAPEQFTDKVVVPQGDIYSLGVLIFELLSGQAPYSGDSTAEVLRKQHHTPLPSLKQFVPDVPITINEIIWRATSKRYTDRYSTVAQMASAFRDAVRANIAMKTTTTTRATTFADTADLSLFPEDDPYSTKMLDSPGGQEPQIRNPYKGLEPFLEADAANFYGRSKDVTTLLSRLQLTQSAQTPRCIALVGASGSGKSSLVRAGLIPALRRNELAGSADWFIATLTPGSQPLTALEQALLSVGVKEAPLASDLQQNPDGLVQAVEHVLPTDATLLLFIDQFEELFTLVQDEADRAHFLDLIQHAVTTKSASIYVVLTLRADFYDRPLAYPFFAELLRRTTEVVLPLSITQLEAVIERPAQRIGLQLEANMAKLIAADVKQQPNALPLLQYTLAQLYDMRQLNLLTFEAYQMLGGVVGSLARSAEELYDTLTEPQRAVAKPLFLRLIALNDSARPTRQRASYADLLSAFAGEDSTEARAVIDLFSKRRLLTFDRDPQTRQPTVEIAHEALITHWSQLQAWVQESLEIIAIQQRLATAVQEWQAAGEDRSYLASGGPLVEFERLLTALNLNQTEAETDYLRRSIQQRAQQQRLRQLAVSALVTITVLSVVFGALAFVQRNRADAAATRARSGELAAIAQTNINRTDLAMLLSTEALRYTNTYEARSSLLASIQRNTFLARYIHTSETELRSVATAPDGAFVVAGGVDGTLRLVNPNTGTIIASGPIEPNAPAINAVAVNPTDATIAYGDDSGTVRLWDADAQAPADGVLQQDAAVWSLAYHPQGTGLATGSADGTLTVWDADTGDVIYDVANAHQSFIYALAYSPDGTRIATGGDDATVRVWDSETGERIAELPPADNWILRIAFSPDGNTLAYTTATQPGEMPFVTLWNVGDEELIGRFPTGHGGWVRDLTYSDDGTRLLTASYDGTLRLWDAATGAPLSQPITGHANAVWDAVFIPDTTQAASVGRGGKLLIHDLERPHPLVQQHAQLPHDLLTLAAAPDGAVIATAGGETIREQRAGDIYLLRANGEQSAVLAGHQGAVLDLALAPGGVLLASSSVDETVRLWDISERELIRTFDGNNGFTDSIAFSADGTQLYAAFPDEGVVAVWNVEGDNPAQRLTLPGTPRTVAPHPNGNQLAVGTDDGQITLWSLPDAATIATLNAHTDTVTDLAYTPDGSILISASRDTTVRMWDTATHDAIGTPLTGHTDWVTGIAIAPTAGVFATTSEDATVILWDVETRQPIGLPLLGHAAAVNSGNFLQDGFVTASADGTVITWQTDPTQWQQTACTVANRNLTAAEWAQYFDEPYRETCLG